MKLIASLLIGGSLFVVGDSLPNVGYDECVIVDVKLTTDEATVIDPVPDVTDILIVEYCGQRVETASGTFLNQAAFKYVHPDLDQAQVLVDGAADLLDNGDAYLNP